ncbi:Insertion element 4 transposase N-terminal [Serratia plymuthica]|uniref:Insertion element 4 transposase N-terminal n=1 Tax=Serratia plymuthica TaxID=82996 RepID=A0A2X4UYG6_SERPL|nr:Insertion element 4 transposase N-terminal [Serratia plymuthica]
MTGTFFYAPFSGSWHYQHYRPEQVQTLADLLPPDLIQQAFSLTDTVTLRKRKLPLESMVWLVIGMAIYNNRPLSQIVNLMDIVDRTGRPFTAPSSVIQRRKNTR